MVISLALRMVAAPRTSANVPAINCSRFIIIHSMQSFDTKTHLWNAPQCRPRILCQRIRVYLWLLSVVAYRLNGTATHCLVTLRFLFLRRGLFIDKRVVVLVTAGKVVRRGVA